LTEVIIGSFLAVTIALAAYFFQKWLGEVEEKINGIKLDVRSLKQSHSELLIEIRSTRNHLSNELKELPQIQAMSSKLDSLDNVKSYLKSEFLPKIQENQAYYGKIIFLEKKSEEFESRLLKVFRAVEILVQQKKSL
jgi:hypothetical protein